jgi:hypothetical protein
MVLGRSAVLEAADGEHLAQHLTLLIRRQVRREAHGMGVIGWSGRPDQPITFTRRLHEALPIKYRDLASAARDQTGTFRAAFVMVGLSSRKAWTYIRLWKDGIGPMAHVNAAIGCMATCGASSPLPSRVTNGPIAPFRPLADASRVVENCR